MEPSASHPKNILVVDDEESVRDLINSFFENEGFTLDTTANGMEAMEKLAAGDVDLLILDLTLPGTSGMEIIRELQGPGWKKVPILVITAKPLTPQEENAIRKEPNVGGFLRKPLHFVQVVELVRRILGA